MKLPPLPPKWKFKSPFLTDEEDYDRYVLSKEGNIDRLRVSQILENHGYSEYSSLWKHGDRQQKTISEVVSALNDIIEAMRDCPDFGAFVTLADGRSIQPLARARAAIAATQQ